MSDAPADISGPVILTIEDEDTQRLLTRDCLEDAGFSVEEASNGKDGLAKARALKPDLVLLDVMMPGMNGIEVCQAIRDDKKIQHTPVIIITGREEISDINKAFDAGATDFLTKPVSWNLLPNRISFVLRTSKLENELRQSRREAVKAYEAKSSLLSTMGHELRTPLNAIIGFSELIKQEPFGPLGAPQYNEFIEDIHSSGTKLLGGINSVLEIADTDSHQLDQDHESIDVFSIVSSAANSLTEEAAEKNIRISVRISDGDTRVNGDRRRLVAAVSNILSNAVKFSTIGSEIDVTSSVSDDGELSLQISDTGIGIPESALQRVMEPFEQADKTLSRNFEGMGMGLSVSRAILQLHGADIHLNSQEGAGTTVSLRFPSERIE